MIFFTPLLDINHVTLIALIHLSPVYLQSLGLKRRLNNNIIKSMFWTNFCTFSLCNDWWCKCYRQSVITPHYLALFYNKSVSHSKSFQKLDFEIRDSCDFKLFNIYRLRGYHHYNHAYINGLWPFENGIATKLMIALCREEKEFRSDSGRIQVG